MNFGDSVNFGECEKMFNLDDSVCVEPIYSKVQRCHVKSEERTRELKITVDFSSSFNKVKNVLNIQLCDDEDPFFYYSLILTEDDYQRLKSIQGLLVDFDHFPSQVIRLLEQCTKDDKFVLFLENEESSTFLKIVEANNFKHLCHLALRIEPAGDTEVKNLMLKKIKTLKDLYVKGEKTISNLESQLQYKTKQLQNFEEKMHIMEKEWERDKLSFKEMSTKEISEEAEKFRKSQLDWQIRSQREKSEIEEKYSVLCREKDTELSRLRLENQIFMEKRNQSDVTIADQARRLEHIEKELSNVRSELVSTRKHSNKVENELYEKDKILNALKTKVAVLEQESKDKTILMSKQQELLNSANDQKTKLEDALSEKEKNLQRKIMSLQNLSDELIKANEIITKMQKEIGVINSKISVRTKIALEQEKVVETHLKTIAKLEEMVSSYEKKIESANEAELTLKTKVSEMQDLLEAKEKRVKDNERIIDWLNRRLTDSVETSTPYRAPRVPLSTQTTNEPSISRLDQLHTPALEGEAENRTPNTKDEKNDKPKKTTTKKPIGFKRLSPGQTSTVPSSYFLK